MMRSFWWAASSLLPLLSLLHGSLVAAQKPKASPWQTLNGDAPVVIAKGGFSGLFPDSSSDAYRFTLMASSLDTILWCDVRLTKDGIGVCLPNLKLDNCTDIPSIYPRGKKAYLVNGVLTKGWFSIDFTRKDLSKVHLTRAIYSRAPNFDASMNFILAVEDVQKSFTSRAIWLNVQNDIFYRQHNLSMRSYILSISRRIIVNYISSSEVDFLRSIVARFQKSKTKLVFRFLGQDLTEPSTNQTYGILLKNLTFIKTFAMGIIVPKTYIWPVTSDQYLLPHTSIVTDAHKEGLKIYAGDFANDFLFAYNYSYDPLAEYLSFIDNGEFSVDGVLTDNPITPSEAIGCFSHINKSSIDHGGKPIIVSHNGASGDYPDCTDLAYKKAVDDGTDIIDCPVQITRDGILICMSSINLMDDTTVGQSSLRSRVSNIPDLQSTPGIFTFNLTWEEIQKNMKPAISNPLITYINVRNPLYKNAGNFLTLSDFLSFAKDKAISGVLITIEHAAFLVEKMGISITDGVISALNDAGYNNQTALQVTIQSSYSSVLVKMKQQTKYKLMYKIDESIRDAIASSIADIKKFATSVAVDKQSIYPDTRGFIINKTNLVKSLQNAGLQVYVYVLQNEFLSQPWDFMSDPYVEINSYVKDALVDGIITDFPATAIAYKRNSCKNLGENMPSYMLPVQVGGLKQLIVAEAQPPVLPPLPLLQASDVEEPSLPPVTPVKPSTPTPAHGNASAPSTQPSILRPVSSVIISMLAIVGSILFI